MTGTETNPKTLLSFGHFLCSITDSLKLAHRLRVQIINTAEDKSLVVVASYICP